MVTIVEILINHRKTKWHCSTQQHCWNMSLFCLQTVPGLISNETQCTIQKGFVLVPSIQWHAAQDLCQASKQMHFNLKGCHHFGFCKSMTREMSREERELSCGSMHWHHALSEPGRSFVSLRKKESFLMDPCIGIMLDEILDILLQVLSVGNFGTGGCP